MHEATIALAILKRTVAAVERAENVLDMRVTRVVVNVGEFRNVDPESLEFAFTALRNDFEVAKNAELELRRINALASCSTAEHEFHPHPDNYFACTICGGGIMKMIHGEELDIVSIQMEELQAITAGSA